MPTSTLSIGGVPIDRDADNVSLNRLVLYSMDGPDELEFTRDLVLPADGYALGSRVELEIDDGGGDDLRFAGEIVSAQERLDARGATIAYRCLGLKWIAATRIPVIDGPTGKASVTFNQKPDDRDYDPDRAGLELGEMIRRVLVTDQVASRLWNEGVEAYTDAPDPGPDYDTGASDPPVLKSDTLADLAAMTVVPREPVTFEGGRLWPQIEAAIQDWMPAIATLILPDGTIRFRDTTALTPRTLTVGTDPIAPPDFRKDVSECATRVRVIGGDHVEGRYLSLADGTLVEDFATGTGYADNAAAKADWDWSKFAEPQGGVSEGDITALSSTTVTVQSDDAAEAWDANRWSDDRARVVVSDPNEFGNITFSEDRRVISNTSLTAAGTSILTLDYPLANSGYERYRLVGKTRGGSLTWRRYEIADAFVAENIVTRFPDPRPFSTTTGVTLVSDPVGINRKSSDDNPPYLEFPAFFSVYTDTADGDARKILFDEPVVRPWTDQADLDAGGASVNEPSDLLLFVPVSYGVLEAVAPSSGYEGTAYSVEGIEREIVVPAPEWRYKGEQALMEAYAQAILDGVKDVVIEGEVTYFGFDAAAVASAGDMALNVASDFGATGYEAVAATVRSVSLSWPDGGAFPFVTTLNVSTRRRPWMGERAFEPVGFLPGSPYAGGSNARGFGLDVVGGWMGTGMGGGQGGGGFGGGS